MRKRSSSPKLLPLNTALLHAFHDPADCDRDAEWRGRVFEAAVGAALCRLPHAVYYWRDGKYEVDFVVDTRQDLFAVEVKSRRIKHTSGLARFLDRYPGATPLIVDGTRGESLLRQMPPADDEPLARLMCSGC